LLIERDSYLIACGRYIEMNPIRAKIVNKPGDYPWSTYKFYAYGIGNDLVDIDLLYQELGRTEKERQLSYRRALEEESKPNLNVRFLGPDSFIEKMESKFGVKNIKNRRGRPPKVIKYKLPLYPSPLSSPHKLKIIKSINGGKNEGYHLR